jgi:hypothetical protein
MMSEVRVVLTKEELLLVNNALQLQFDVDNDSVTEPLFDLTNCGSPIVASELLAARKTVEANLDNLLVLTRLQARLNLLAKL